MNKFLLQRALNSAVAVFFAMCLAYYLSLPQIFMVLITPLLILQTTLGTPLRQLLIRFLVIALAVVIGSVVVLYQPLYLHVILIHALLVGLIFGDDTHSSQISTRALAALVVLIALLTPFHSFHLLSLRLYNVILGAMIALVCHLVIFPIRPAVEFRKGIIPVLSAFSDYLTAIVELPFQKNHAAATAYEKKIAVEKVLQLHHTFFPAWVYEPGFNPQLSKGYRYFLVKTVQTAHILFALHAIAATPMDAALLEKIKIPLQDYAEHCRALIAAILTKLHLKPITHPISDFAEEMTALETEFQKAIPLPLELLDISEEYLDLAAFVYDLKDLRENLLQLVESLR